MRDYMNKTFEYDLLPKQKKRSFKNIVNIELYSYASSLWKELNKVGAIDRLNSIPQLGRIEVKKNLMKCRLDYVMLQLYFHDIVRKELSQDLKFSYGNRIDCHEFLDPCQSMNLKPTIMDLLQIFTIVNNIGHFHNTFVSSQSAIMLLRNNKSFEELLLGSCERLEFKRAVQTIIDEENYHRFHLINSLLVLEECDKTNPSVELAKQLIYSYINESALEETSKLKFVYQVYRNIRSVAYITYDLQIAQVPILIDISSYKQLKTFFKELLAEYNNKSLMQQLIVSINKMLDDMLYNEISKVICYYHMSKKIAKKVGEKIDEDPSIDYYRDFFLSNTSSFNVEYPRTTDYYDCNYLKLTFSEKEKSIAQSLIDELDSMEHISIGCYDRHNNMRTVVISLKRTCNNCCKVAFRVLKTTIKYLIQIPNITNDDARYILIAKFFLYYFFGKRFLEIKSTIDEKTCVACVRGTRKRIDFLDEFLKNGTGTEDQNHEIEHLRYVLSLDKKNDVTLMIVGSIVAIEKKEPYCEFDGMIIFPNRKDNQIVFLEAKNRGKKGKATAALKRKLKKLNIAFLEKDIIKNNTDVFLCVNI